MSTDRDAKINEFIPVNQVLNAKPQLGPIPGEQVIPWVLISIIAYGLCQGVFGLGWLPSLLVTVWGCASWWVLNGNESWRYLSKFHSAPHWRQGGPLPYRSLLDQNPSAKGRRTSIPPRSRKKRRTQP